MAGSIGIKQANGDFFSILDENSTAKKRLILTTVHDNQKSVQIDLFRSLSKSMTDAMYIGSIVVENISQKPKGEPSIEMTLSSTQDGSVSASAVDLGNPENKHHLSISLKSLEEDKNDYPDFEFETEQKSTIESIASNRKFPWIPIILIGLVLLLVCLGLWFFLFRNKDTEPARNTGRQTPPAVAVQKQPANSAGQTNTGADAGARPAASKPVQDSPPEASAQSSQEPKQTAAVQPAPQVSEPVQKASEPVPALKAEQKQPIVIEKPPQPQPQAAARNRLSAPVYSFSVPQTIPPEGIVYKIRWGDTLWDISEAFYRNPRLYTFIVRSNGIHNPNLIVSGTELNIIPRN